MEFVYFTIAGLFLYVAADWVLLKIEAFYGKLLPNRSLFFFGIIMIMTLVSFELINYLAPRSLEGEAQGVVLETPEGISQGSTAKGPVVPTGPSFNTPPVPVNN
jgi:hypothetical protein